MSNMPPTTVGQLSVMVQGTVVGNSDVLVSDALPLPDAVEGSITLLDDTKSGEALQRCPARSAVVPLGFRLPESSAISEMSVIEVESPHRAFETIVRYFRASKLVAESGVHFSAQIHPTAQLGLGTVIHAGAVVGPNCRLGKNCTLYPGVTLLADCKLGDDCTIYPSVVLYPNSILHDRVLIHSGSVLGAFGFGYRTEHGHHQRTAQLGWVEIESDVEIGAGTTIDRGTYGATRIGEGTKIDNQVMIGHNCQIGKHNLICAQVGIAGSSSTGDYVVIAGQVGIKDHVHIGDRVVIAAKSGIMSDVRAEQVIMGTPAIPIKEHMQLVAVQIRLPEMRNQMRELCNEVESLKRLLGQTQQRAA